jgi:hypothetical protein
MELRELADIGGVSGLLVSTRSIYKQHLQAASTSSIYKQFVKATDLQRKQMVHRITKCCSMSHMLVLLSSALAPAKVAASSSYLPSTVVLVHKHHASLIHALFHQLIMLLNHVSTRR